MDTDISCEVSEEEECSIEEAEECQTVTETQCETQNEEVCDIIDETQCLRVPDQVGNCSIFYLCYMHATGVLNKPLKM